MKKFFILAIAALPLFAISQNSKRNTAYRLLEDYNRSLKDNPSQPDLAVLLKAKEAIDLTTVHTETKDQAKTWLYRTQIYYSIFQNNLKTEQDKLATVSDKNEKIELAYGNVSVTEYEEAGTALEQLKKLDKNKDYQQEINVLGFQMMQDLNNIAIGKFKIKKFDEAIDYFNKSYDITKAVTNKKDTNSLYNCVIAAQKAKNLDKIKSYSQKMIDEKVANSYSYTSLVEAKLTLKDTAGALQTIKEGRMAFPNDIHLMNRETEFYLLQGKHQEALDNLNKAIEKDPNNGSLFLVRGNVYDNLANPKEGKNDKEKPKNYEELMGKAEADYKKATEATPANFDVWYNLGALYNNWGGYYQNLANGGDLTKAKDLEAKAQVQLKKAVPALEKALELNPNDRGTMFALRKLYLLTNNPQGAEEMNKRMKK